MAEPTVPPPAAPPNNGPFGRPIMLALLCLASVVMAAGTLGSALHGFPNAPPETNIPPFPAWFSAFASVQGATMLLAAVGLWFFKRWGFALLALSYAAMIVGLLVAHQPWVCAAAVQFPLFAIASKQWKLLR